MRYPPLHSVAAERIYSYLELAVYGQLPLAGPLFRATWGPKRTGGLLGLGVHGLRATAATNALEHEADIAKMQQRLGHANISTTRLYDRQQNRPEYSPTLRVKY